MISAFDCLPSRFPQQPSASGLVYQRVGFQGRHREKAFNGGTAAEKRHRRENQLIGLTPLLHVITGVCLLLGTFAPSRPVPPETFVEKVVEKEKHATRSQKRSSPVPPTKMQMARLSAASPKDVFLFLGWLAYTTNIGLQSVREKKRGRDKEQPSMYVAPIVKIFVSCPLLIPGLDPATNMLIRNVQNLIACWYIFGLANTEDNAYLPPHAQKRRHPMTGEALKKEGYVRGTLKRMAVVASEVPVGMLQLLKTTTHGLFHPRTVLRKARQGFRETLAFHRQKDDKNPPSFLNPALMYRLDASLSTVLHTAMILNAYDTEYVSKILKIRQIASIPRNLAWTIAAIKQKDWFVGLCIPIDTLFLTQRTQEYWAVAAQNLTVNLAKTMHRLRENRLDEAAEGKADAVPPHIINRIIIYGTVTSLKNLKKIQRSLNGVSQVK